MVFDFLNLVLVRMKFAPQNLHDLCLRDCVKAVLLNEFSTKRHFPLLAVEGSRHNYINCVNSVSMYRRVTAGEPGFLSGFPFNVTVWGKWTKGKLLLRS